MSENVGAATSRNAKGLHGLYRDNFTLPYLNLICDMENCNSQQIKIGVIALSYIIIVNDVLGS
jgi:hypothetical protein